MKLYNINNVKGFFETVKDCKGDVRMVLSQGRSLDLKEEADKYADLLGGLVADEGIHQINIKAQYPEDISKLLTFAVFAA